MPMPTVTATALPLAWAPLQAALRQRCAVHVCYHGRQRLICPHALGWKNRTAMVLGYQIGGQTSTGTLDPDPRKRWRCLFVDEIELVAADHTAPWQTADNGRDRPHGRPPAQIPACGTTALGSCLRFWRRSAPQGRDARCGQAAAIER